MKRFKMRDFSKKEGRFINEFQKMSWKSPSRFSSWYDSLSDDKKQFLEHLERNARFNPHLFDFSNVEQIEAELEKEYEEDFR